MIEHCYNKDFQYRTHNPYSDRLKAFGEFVSQDNEAESLQGLWNQNIFQRSAPLYLEIGSGYGDYMLNYCTNNPNINYIGMDYRFKRSYKLAQKLEKLPVKNFHFLRAKGERIGFLFNKNEIDAILYFFPDPWPKTRHHKKRLFQPHFLEIAWNVLKPQGKFYIKTDHDQYADWMKKIIDESSLFSCDYCSTDLWNTEQDHHPFLCNGKTKFEKIFVNKGIRIKAFELTSTKKEHGT